MGMIRILRPDFQFTDDRGVLTQLVHEGYKQINILISRQGIERGRHFHKICHEAFYVIDGSVQLHLQKGMEKDTVKFSAGDFFEIPPCVLHSMYFTEDCVMLQMYDEPVEAGDGLKDIHLG